MRTVLREVLKRVRLRAPSQRPERGLIRHVTVVPGRGCRAIVEENGGSRVAARSQVGRLAVEPTAELAGAENGRPGVADASSEVTVGGHD